MKLPDFLNTYRGMTTERNFSRGIILVLSLVVMFLSFALAMKKPIVVLVPPNLEKEAEIAHNESGAEIKKAWGLTTASLVGNVSPGNVDFVERAISGLLSPALYLDMLQDLHDQANVIRDGDIAMTFTPISVFYQKSTNKTFVTGDWTREARFGTPERGKKTYEMEIKIENYRPVIVEWAAYEGGARTNEPPPAKGEEKKDVPAESETPKWVKEIDQMEAQPLKKAEGPKAEEIKTEETSMEAPEEEALSPEIEPADQEEKIKGENAGMEDKLEEILQ